MANRKRPLDAVSGSDDRTNTPEKRVSVPQPLDSDYMDWGVEETCQYLRREKLEKWEDIFRGWFLFERIKMGILSVMTAVGNMQSAKRFSEHAS